MLFPRPALQAVANCLPDATKHYFLKANYYDPVVNNHIKWWPTAIWHNTETTRNFGLGTDGLRLDILLDDRHLDHWTRVGILHKKIWDILHRRTAGGPNPNGWATTLFYHHAVMRMPPLN